jgi:hypothetical protein
MLRVVKPGDTLLGPTAVGAETGGGPMMGLPVDLKGTSVSGAPSFPSDGITIVVARVVDEEVVLPISPPLV